MPNRIATVVTLALITLAASSAPAVEPDFEVCVDRYPLTPLERILYSSALFNPRIDSLTAEGYADAAALLAGANWDFSGMSGTDVIIQNVPVDSTWSCTVSGSCSGFAPAFADSLRTIDIPSTNVRNVWAFQHDGSGKLLFRGFVNSEGSVDELRICSTDDFAFFDFAGPGLCLNDATPAWANPVPCAIWARGDDPCGLELPDTALDGQLPGRVVRTGTLTLPSGHVLDTVLVELIADFDLRRFELFTCTVAVDQLRQYILQWIVPDYGMIVEMNSMEVEPDLSWQVADSVTIGHGLLPPLSIQVDSVSGDRVTVSWDPGRTSAHIDEYVVYWGEQPGEVVAPPFSSERVGDTILAPQTSYTITGLDAGKTYHISVTSKSRYIDPYSLIETPYESIAMPSTIGADIDGDGNRDTSYPPEVTATTTGAIPIALLRDALDSIDPPSPAKALVLPLDAGDLYISDFLSGDPDPTPLGQPLVFYATNPARDVMLVKSAGSVAISF